MTERIASLAALCERYDGFLIDQFGVLLNGTGAYPFAVETLRALARRGKQTLLLSNSGKRSHQNEARLDRLGFSRESYLGVLSSGETAYAELARRIGRELPSGASVWELLTEDAPSPLEGLPLTRCGDPAKADALLIGGCRPWAASLADYAAQLRPAAEAGVRAFCSNPDLRMMVGGQLMFGSGRVARLYEDLGGRVEWFGKPFPAIYVEALRRLAGVERARIVCIGDSPAHDILGGARAGLATALVRTGVHADESEDEALARCDALGVRPDYLLPDAAF